MSNQEQVMETTVAANETAIGAIQENPFTPEYISQLKALVGRLYKQLQRPISEKLKQKIQGEIKYLESVIHEAETGVCEYRTEQDAAWTEIIVDDESVIPTSLSPNETVGFMAQNAISVISNPVVQPGYVVDLHIQPCCV